MSANYSYGTQASLGSLLQYCDSSSRADMEKALNALEQGDLRHWWHCFSSRFPPYEELEQLKQQAQDAVAPEEREEKSRRVKIWQFFFYPDTGLIDRLFKATAKELGIGQGKTPYEVFCSLQNAIEGFFQRALREKRHGLEQERDRQLQRIQEEEEQVDKMRRQGRGVAINMLFVGLGIALARIVFEQDFLIPIGALIFIASFIAIIALSVRRTEFSEQRQAVLRVFEEQRALVEGDIQRRRVQALSLLQNAFDAAHQALRQQVQEVSGWDEMVHRWFEEDLVKRRQTALERMSFEPELAEVSERDATAMLFGESAPAVDGTSADFPVPERRIPNPLVIHAPADLQSDYPPIFERDEARKKHLHAKKVVRLSSGKIDILHGVYYIQVLLIGRDMLAIYSCFFDFILGTVYGERFSEQYYEDVVSIGSRGDYREVPAPQDFFEVPNATSGPSRVIIEDIPTFTMSLSSAEQFTISMENVQANRYYVNYVKRLQKTGQPAGESQILSSAEEIQLVEAVDWTAILDNLLRALRVYLRKHKRSMEEQVRMARDGG